jgi:ATP-dependent RNA helicase HelY
MPDARSNEAMTAVRQIWRDVSLVERDARLPRGSEPDIGFSEVAFGWAAGRSLSTVLSDTELTAGDFVRWVRQVIDFAGQIADAAGPGDLREVARRLVRTMRRGVVSYAPEVDADEGDDLTGDDLP